MIIQLMTVLYIIPYISTILAMISDYTSQKSFSIELFEQVPVRKQHGQCCQFLCAAESIAGEEQAAIVQENFQFFPIKSSIFPNKISNSYKQRTTFPKQNLC